MRKFNVSREIKSIVAFAMVLVLTVLGGVPSADAMPSDGLDQSNQLLLYAAITDENWLTSIAIKLQGGVRIAYQVVQLEGTEGDFDDLHGKAIEHIQSCLKIKGYSGFNVAKLGKDGIRIDVPYVNDPGEILDLVGTACKLAFADPDGNVFMEGKHIESVFLATDEYGEPAVGFYLTSEGSRIFAEMTAKSIGKNIAITMDGEVLVNPTVQSAITDGSGIIAGMGIVEDAQSVALQIQRSTLPLELKLLKADTVSPGLERDLLGACVRAMITRFLSFNPQ